MNRKAVFPILFLLAVPFLAVSQEAVMESAEKLFAKLSASYGSVQDYEADLTITQGKTISRGKLSYKSPMYLHLDFTDPAKQVWNFDGQTLTVYVPSEQVILSQRYKKKTPSQVESLVTSQGLALMQRNYSIGYLTGPTPVPLEDGSKEMVVKLKLVSSGGTSFNQLILSISGPTDALRVRRVEGTQANGEQVVMDFANIRVNQGIPDSRFVYSGPPDASVISDWLFDSEQ